MEMRIRPFALAALSLAMTASVASCIFPCPTSSMAQQPGGPSGRNAQRPTKTGQEIAMVSPALERYTQDIVRGDLWKRPDLSPRDRSIVTLAALISRNQTVELASYLEIALDSGVKPREISEIIAHLAFYSGWANAMSAVAVTKDVFARRHVVADELPKASPELLPLN
jgi:4-carboxymuconolactone decarboxylase